MATAGKKPPRVPPRPVPKKGEKLGTTDVNVKCQTMATWVPRKTRRGV